MVCFLDPVDYGVTGLVEQGGGLRVAAFNHSEQKAFHQRLERGTCAFVVVRGHPDEARKALNSLEPHRVTGILLRSLRNPARDDPELGFGRGYSLISTTSPARPGSVARDRFTATLVKEIATVAKLASDRDISLPGEWSHISSSVLGPEQGSDVWALLYDRIWAAGCDVSAAILISGPIGASQTDRSDLPPDWARTILFPDNVIVNSHMVHIMPSKKAAQVSALAPIRNQPEAAGHRGQVIRQLLTVRRWPILGSSRADEAIDLLVDERGRQVRFILDPGDDGRADWRPKDLEKVRLDKINTVAVMPDVHAGRIAARLLARNELAVSMRDLCASDGGAGIYSLIAAQLRRLGGRPPSRSGTAFLGMLLHAGLRDENVIMSDGEAIWRALRHEQLGRRLFFTCNRLRHDKHHIRALVRLVEREHPGLQQAVSDILEPFEISVGPRKIVLNRI